MTTKEEIAVPEELAIHVDKYIDKHTYNCVDDKFVEILKAANIGKIPEKVYLCGVDTDCCVLMIAGALFERGIIPIILEKYIDSTGGIKSHKAGLKALERLVGKQNISKALYR